MKIVDCFTFYNELDMLYYRLNALYDYVDYFILVEARITHAGNPKPLFYMENEHLYQRFRDKIIHMVVDLPFKAPDINYNNNEQWVNENEQRNKIKEGLATEMLGLSDNDLVIISDVDEIIDPQRLVEFRDGRLVAYNGFSLAQDMYYYNLTCKNTWFWSKAKIVSYKYILQKTPEEIRQGNLPLLENGGWHLSYFGDTAYIKNKLREFSHQEYNSPEFTDENAISERLSAGVDLFGRSYVNMTNIQTSQNTYLPPMYDIYLKKYMPSAGYTKQPGLPIYLYYHVCCIANWRVIMSRMLFKLRNSGLYDAIDEIRITVLGSLNNLADNLFKDAKIKIRFHSEDMSLYERHGLNQMIDDAQTEEFYALYLHSKGVKHWKDPCTEHNVIDWCEYMMYFNVYKHNICIEELTRGASAVGCNLQERGAPLHYSGNFWWSKSSHIKNLPKIADTYYNTPEFLVSSIDGVYKSLWHSEINHYHSLYPAHMYENKPDSMQTIVRTGGNVLYM